MKNTSRSHIFNNGRIVLCRKVFPEVIVSLLTCSKLQQESQLIKLKKKKALSADNLEKTFVKLNQNTNLADQRLLTVILIAFCGLMRFKEVSRLSRSDFIFSSTYVKVFIENSKTDIYREGMWLHISVSSKTFYIKTT